MSIRSIRIRATITMEIAASDFIEAGEHQRRLDQHVQQLRAAYPDAVLDLREARVRTTGGTPRREPAPRPASPPARDGLIPYRRVR